MGEEEAKKEVTDAILGYLKDNEQIQDSGKFAEETGFSHDAIVNGIKSLHADKYVIAQDIKKENYQLTAEGKTYAANGSPEFQLFTAIPPKAISKDGGWVGDVFNLFAYRILSLLQKKVGDVFKIGCQQASKNGWVEMGKTVYRRVKFQLFTAIPPKADPPKADPQKADPPKGISIVDLQKKVGDVFKIGCQQASKNGWVEMGKTVYRRVEHVDDNVKVNLVKINDGEARNLEENEIKALKQRKLISLQTWKGFSVTKGPNYAPTRKKFATDLTRENLSSGEWRDLEFKKYNFSAKGVPTEGGHLHPLLKVKKQIQTIFLQMGFEEMPTNNYVESSFWNFDALFQPQQHPARDSHDTFYLKEPSTTRTLPEDYVARVKQIHESGGHGSRGYGYDWKREESNKNVLRTHTTAVSSRMLYALAQKPYEPKKYYSIDRVFRNEAVDRTHLAEFHQIEGLICDRGLSLGDLEGVLHDFFSRLGMTKLRFKPAYNPYTEPSMEIFGYHEGFKKWVEVGNSGMFRPEMLLPMGLPEDVRVIAWGLSLERPTMILYGYDNIRDLFGSKVDLGLIKRNPICKIGLQSQPDDEDVA